jgi:hypothetical protein
LAKLVDDRKRAIETGDRRFERDREYGDECGNAKAIESLALEEYEARLRQAGMTPAEIAETVTRPSLDSSTPNGQ